MNRLADDHNGLFDLIFKNLELGKIGVQKASEQLKLLGYNHDERWEMIQNRVPKPKVVKFN
jgi:hypothetical protein